MEENREGLPILGTDFASKGFLWARNLCQKWEDICRENITIQESSKFVDAVSLQFRNILEDVADDLFDRFLDGCSKGPVSDLSLEHDVIAEICKKSKIDHDQDHVDEQPIVSNFSEDSMDISVGQNVNGASCTVINNKDIVAVAQADVYNCSSEVRGDHEENSPSFVDHFNNSGFPISDGALHLSQCAEVTTQVDSGSWFYSTKTEENAEDKTLVQTKAISNIYEEKCSSAAAGLPFSPTEHGVYMRRKQVSSIPWSLLHTLQRRPSRALPLTMVFPNDNYLSDGVTSKTSSLSAKLAYSSSKASDDFEDVGLDDLHREKKEVDFREDGENFKLSSSPPLRAVKKSSYKKMFKSMCSNLYSLRKNNNDSHSFIPVDTASEVRNILTMPSVSDSGLSTPESGDAEWELI